MTGARLPLLVTAYTVTSFGSYLNMLALGLFAFHLTGSALQTGLFMALRLGSGFVAGPVAGWLASRYPRKVLMIFCDLLSAIAIGALVLRPSTGLLYGLAAVLGATQALWGVAMRSSVPELVGHELRTRANSLLVTGRSIAMLLGFASAGVLVAQFGYQTVFLLDALSYVVCVCLLIPVPLGRNRSAAQPGSDSRRLVFGALAPILLGMMAVRAIDAFGSSSHNVALPVYANLVSAADPAAFAAVFTTAWAVGSLAVGRRLASRNHAGDERGFGVATALMSVFFVLAFTGLPIWLLIPVAMAAGAADGYAEISYTSRLQAVDDSQRAQLFGFAAATQNAGFGVGMVGCGVLLELFGPLTVVAAAHTFALLGALTFLILVLRPRRLHTAEVIR